MHDRLIGYLATVFGSWSRNSNSNILRRYCLKVWEKYFSWRKLEVSAEVRYGVKFRLILPDSIQSSIFLTGEWEPNISRLIQSTLQPGDIFVDVGANIGWHTIMASKLVGSEGKVFAFEASPSICNSLLFNLTENGIQNVDVFNVAVSGHSGVCAIFNAPSGNLGHSTIVDSVAARDGHKLESYVKCDRLSAWLDPNVLFDARLIKIDIEGAERMAIEGVANVLGQFSRKCEWLVELSPEFSPNGQVDIDWIFDQFLLAGYRAFRIENSYGDVGHKTKPNDDVALTKIDTAPTKRLNDVLFTRAR